MCFDGSNITKSEETVKATCEFVKLLLIIYLLILSLSLSPHLLISFSIIWWSSDFDDPTFTFCNFHV